MLAIFAHSRTLCMRLHLLFIGIVVVMLSACATHPPSPPDPRLTPVTFTALDGWQSDDFTQALPSLANSCRRLVTLPDDRSLGASGAMGNVKDWRSFCGAVLTIAQTSPSSKQIRTFLENWLQPWALSNGAFDEGLFTGYYESELHGSLTHHDQYQWPLYRLPEPKNSSLMHLERSQIAAGALADKNLELVWLDDPIDAFFVEVQGSGRIHLDNGRTVSVSFAGKNGYPYVSIGKQLVERGEIKLEDVSLQSLRAWLESHPSQQQSIFNLNPSFVFFKLNPVITPPKGAANTPLTAQRSLAVDSRYIGYHVPIWLKTDMPLHQLVIAQDTGGAIKGVVRGDFFWGFGPSAEQKAGSMRSIGRMFVLLPRGFQPLFPARPSS